MEYWLTAGVAALAGGLVAALIGAVVTISMTSRNIFQKAVIEQRQVWRDSLRKLIPLLLSKRNSGARLRIRDTIVLHLNPSKDVEAVDLIDAYILHRSRTNRDAVVRHFQIMLKRDWERSKIEAQLFSRDADARAAEVVEAQIRIADQRR